jgi:hypothetical protein
MKSIAITADKPGITKGLILDFIAIAFIYFVPSLSHLINLPVYMIEPMRLMLILSMVYSGRFNSFLLAMTLPLFSFLVSSHPAAVKMLIITAELVLNVFLFYFFLGRFIRPFFAMISSIILSKLMAYVLYFVFFSLAFVRSEAEISFLLIQLVMTILFSAYTGLFLMTKKQQNE